MSSAARTAATAGSLTTHAAIATVPSARAQRRRTGSPPARPTCCRSATSTGLHPAGRDRPDRLPEQGGGLRSVVPHGVRDIAHHRRRSKASRRPHWRHRRAPQLGLGNDPPSTPAYDRAGRWNIARWYALGALPTRLPVASARAVPPVPAALPDAARRRPCGGPAGILRRARRPAQPGGLCRLSRATEEEELVRLRQAPFCGPRRCSPISRATPTASPSRTAD